MKISISPQEIKEMIARDKRVPSITNPISVWVFDAGIPMTQSRAKELQDDLAGLVRQYKVLRDLSRMTLVMIQVLPKHEEKN